MPDAWIHQWGDPTLRVAPTQVGVLRRVFVYRLDPDEGPDALINPRIVRTASSRSTAPRPTSAAGRSAC
jgi:peptide deformylase